jgi:class 3 adenylate cyclase
MQRKLAAILALDVVGYSSLMEADEAGTFARVKALEEQLFEPQILKHRGCVFKLMGDGLLAEFGSVVDAIECAVAIQSRLADRNADVPDGLRIDVRIGINLGEIIVEGEDRFGEGVNIAARLQQLAGPGGIVVSGKVAKEIDRKLPLKLKPLGDQRVKNIVEPVAVYRVTSSNADPIRKPRGPKQRSRSLWLPALIVVLAVIGAAAYSLQTRGAGHSFPNKPSLAVLPITNIGGDAKWQRFADGLTEDIITELSHWRDIVVIARNSTETYKNKPVDVREVGKTLGVQYLLQGSVQPGTIGSG